MYIILYDISNCDNVFLVNKFVDEKLSKSCRHCEPCVAWRSNLLYCFEHAFIVEADGFVPRHDVRLDDCLRF
jgi:hypothetical protein